MATLTELVKSQVETIKDILNLILELLSILGKNKPLIIILLIITITYLGIKYYAFEVPKSKIYSFHYFIDEQKYEEAWSLLSRRYKKKYFNNNISNFKNEVNPNGMGRYSDIQISDDYDGNNPFSILFKENLIFTVSLTRKNTIHIKDLKNTGNIYYQFRASLWLQLSYNRRLEEITKGNYGTQLDYVSISERKFELVRENGNWVIEDNPKIYEGYKFRNFQ